MVDYVKGVIDLSPETTSSSGTGLALVARFLATDDHLDDYGEDEHVPTTWVSVWGYALGGVKKGILESAEKAASPEAPSS